MKPASTHVCIRHTYFVLLFLIATTCLESCGFCGRSPGELCILLGTQPTSKLTSAASTIVFEQPGTLIVYHGTGCAESNKSGTQIVTKVEQSLNLPGYVNNATVILNGWHLQYLSSDHHMAGLGVAIDSIRLERNTLKWQTAGILSDKNFDDGYSWCYHYTIIAWNSGTLNLRVNHKDGGCTIGDPLGTNVFSAQNDGTTTALSSFASFLYSPDFSNTNSVAIVPRGFGFQWSRCETDHHLLQLSYNLGPSEFFLEKGKKYKKSVQEEVSPFPNSVNRVNPGYVSWETAAILKDNDTRREYTFGELVSALSGDDLGIVHPPFSILPKEDESWSAFTTCLSGNGIDSREFIIENIPYEYAIPVLTGWDLNYGCGDQHIQEIGVWISGFSYERAPNAATGKLRYKLSSVLRDDDNQPYFENRHNVTIVGLKPIIVKGLPTGVQQQMQP